MKGTETHQRWVKNVFISDSEDKNSDRDTNNGEWSTTPEEEGDKLSDSKMVTWHSKNWYPQYTVVTNSSHELLVLIETLGFDSITSGKYRVMGERIAEELMRSELGKVNDAGLHISQGTYCSGPTKNGQHQTKD